MFWTCISKIITFLVNRGSLRPYFCTNLVPRCILLFSFPWRLFKPQAAGTVFRPVILFLIYSLGFVSLACLPGIRSAALRIPQLDEMMQSLWKAAVWLCSGKLSRHQVLLREHVSVWKVLPCPLGAVFSLIRRGEWDWMGGSRLSWVLPTAPPQVSPVSCPVLQWPHA